MNHSNKTLFVFQSVYAFKKSSKLERRKIKPITTVGKFRAGVVNGNP